MKKTLLATSTALLLLSACATQDDGDVLFSDTEKAIIKTLVYSDPPDDPTNAYDQNSAAATLGQMFFWDTQFSGQILVQGNRTTSPINFSAGQEKRIACVTCHVPSAGWADNVTKPNDVSLGANFTSRNTPTVLNTAKNTYSLWDGASDTLWGVARPPIEGAPHNFHRYGVAYAICNSNATIGDNTGGEADYRGRYTAIFGAPDCTNTGTAPSSGNSYKATFDTMSSTQQGTINLIFANFGKAIAAYERLLVSKNSAFDQWANGNENAMTVAQKRGLKIFIGKGNCVRCHSGSNFSDGSFHNLGVPQVGGFSGSNDQGRSDGVSALFDSTKSAPFNTASVYNDDPSVNRVSSLSVSTSAASDVGKFKTPTLRSVNKTAPYFHNGTFSNLWDVVNFYNFAGDAGNFPGTKDTILTTRHMTNEEMEDLVNFLKALEGEALSDSLTKTNLPAAQTTASWP